MFKPFYKNKGDIKTRTTKYLQSIDAIFADTKIMEHTELEEEIQESTTVIIKKKWWKCC
jgi:hypothetical protein